MIPHSWWVVMTKYASYKVDDVTMAEIQPALLARNATWLHFRDMEGDPTVFWAQDVISFWRTSPEGRSRNREVDLLLANEAKQDLPPTWLRDENEET